MKRDAATFVEILEQIESAERKHILYETESVWPDGYVDWERPKWSDYQAFHIDLMIEKGLIKTHVITGEDHQEAGDREVYLVATNASFDYLAEHRQNSVFNRSIKFMMRLFEKALSSIVLPIIVSVLTVVILAYLT